MEYAMEQSVGILVQYGALGVICVLLILGIAWLTIENKNTTNERNSFYDAEIREIKESQKEMFEIMRDSVDSFKQVTQEVGRQTTILIGVKDQVNKIEWEMGSLSQKVDKIQERQDHQINNK